MTLLAALALATAPVTSTAPVISAALTDTNVRVSSDFSGARIILYRAASNRPLADIANFGTLRRLGAGMDHLPISAPAEQRTETRYGVRDVVVSRLGADYYVWRRAVVRLKQNAGLYDEDERGVRFVDRGLFRAEISLPAGAPTGVYRADILLFKDGRPVAVRSRTLTVEKVGLERALYVWAHVRPWSYGLASMVFALAAGWAASAAFRRD